MGLKDQGAGMPDGGLFNESQFATRRDHMPLPGQMPEPGVIEVKPVGADLGKLAATEQVVRYWTRYRLVLVTDLREFSTPAAVRCGTGAYLVETLAVIGERLKAKGTDALAPQRLKRAMTERVFGFEILPAPLVVAHLQIGLLLTGLGAPLGEDERAGVYLTNALTGWEPPKGPKQHLIFPELEQERDAAESVKREKPILVILGNPPYNAFAGVAQGEERDLVEPYKQGLTKDWVSRSFLISNDHQPGSRGEPPRAYTRTPDHSGGQCHGDESNPVSTRFVDA